eukprot:gene2933-3511_t
MGLLRLLVVLVTSGATGARPMGGCDNGISCRNVTGSDGLTFGCRFAGSFSNLDQTKNVLLLHGFPEFSEMYSSLMRTLGTLGFKSVACNQRAYSPGAAPSSKGDYLYTTLAADVLGIAGLAFGSAAKFHLIGHDHGAALGWLVATTQSQNKVLTYTSLSIPHPNAFSDGLYGPSADPHQQVASQYFTMFTLNNSASLHDDLFWRSMAGSGDADAGNFWTQP